MSEALRDALASVVDEIYEDGMYEVVDGRMKRTREIAAAIVEKLGITREDIASVVIGDDRLTPELMDRMAQGYTALLDCAEVEP